MSTSQHPDSPEPKIVVFISYSHDSDEHRALVLKLSKSLRDDGIATILDRYVEGGSPAEGWPRWMMNGLDAATHVLCVCTETYYRRYRGQEVPGKGKGVDWEGALMTQELYQLRSVSTKFIPVLFRQADEAYIPEPLRPQTHYLVDSLPGYQSLYDAILNQISVEPGAIGTLKRKPRLTSEPLSFLAQPNTAKAQDTTPVQRARATEKKRHVDAIAPSHAKLGDDIDVMVKVRLPSSDPLSARDFIGKKPETVVKDMKVMQLAFATDPESGEQLPARMMVKVVAPDFRIQGSAEQLLEVPPNEDSDTLPFILVPEKVGDCRINIELLSMNGQHLKTLPLSTEVKETLTEAGKYAVTTMVVDVEDDTKPEDDSKSTDSDQSPAREALNLLLDRVSAFLFPSPTRTSSHMDRLESLTRTNYKQESDKTTPQRNTYYYGITALFLFGGLGTYFGFNHFGGTGAGHTEATTPIQLQLAKLENELDQRRQEINKKLAQAATKQPDGRTALQEALGIIDGTNVPTFTSSEFKGKSLDSLFLDLHQLAPEKDKYKWVKDRQAAAEYQKTLAAKAKDLNENWHKLSAEELSSKVGELKENPLIKTMNQPR